MIAIANHSPVLERNHTWDEHIGLTRQAVIIRERSVSYCPGLLVEKFYCGYGKDKKSWMRGGFTIL
jgi:hypothetical protein